MQELVTKRAIQDVKDVKALAQERVAERVKEPVATPVRKLVRLIPMLVQIVVHTVAHTVLAATVTVVLDAIVVHRHVQQTVLQRAIPLRIRPKFRVVRPCIW